MLGTYAYTPYMWPMLISAVICGALAIYAWRHRHIPGATAFAVQQLFVALWALFTAIEMAGTTLETRILHHKTEAVAALSAISAGFYFALEYASSGRWATRRTARLLALNVLLISGLIATNDLHHLVWTRMWVDGVVQIERGILNAILLVPILTLPMLGIFLFGRRLARSAGIYRRQALLLFIGAALPILALVLEMANVDLLPPLDPVIIMWSLSGLLYALAIFRFRLLEAVPVGREMAIERLPSGIMVLDAEDRVVDLNPAAGQVLRLERDSVAGRLAREVLAGHVELVNLLDKKVATSTEVVLGRTGGLQYYRVERYPLTHPRGSHLGWLILLQDVTEQRRAQANLLEQQAAVAALREREELARELHDGLGQVLSYVKLQTEAARELLAQNRPDKADVYLAQLAAAAQAAHADVRDYIRAATSETTSIEQGFRAALEQVLDRFSQTHRLDIELDLPADLPDERFGPEVTSQLLRIVQEAVTNAHKHAHASRVCVQVAARDGTAEVTIIDDGMGFDPQQTASRGFGLRFMAERAQAVGGRMQVHSACGEGTTVRVQVPLRQPDRSTKN
jgi:PAS domain S-box-containing protein